MASQPKSSARISARQAFCPVFEPPQVCITRSARNSPHYDFVTSTKPVRLLGYYGQRIATFLIYLNEDFEGSETEFPAIGLSYRGKTGGATVRQCRSVEPSRHEPRARLPLTSGERIFSQWIRIRPAAPSMSPVRNPEVQIQPPRR
jgi:hypothetical protein